MALGGPRHGETSEKCEPTGIERRWQQAEKLQRTARPDLEYVRIEGQRERTVVESRKSLAAQVSCWYRDIPILLWGFPYTAGNLVHEFVPAMASAPGFLAEVRAAERMRVSLVAQSALSCKSRPLPIGRPAESTRQPIFPFRGFC